ncbi:cytochrome c oxidase subunit II [Litorilinea aerophila]|uniref:Cytochrome c oxidase subunit 2 n=1 Tax=Litorilinea aerophila TaxID=1204385 RepID=A0A540VK79_9CHLR|nr:cytochrome c oxidase subunit II [Litorilinea aerophila]MCC9075237.1 cytochrome c oxidase subunit II [Litorilinea aerophila]GIV78378.1 MAG: hypothetical protein KatS3mg050_2772 [Litorilinea sp.]
MPKSSTDKRHFIIVAALIAISTVVLDWLLRTVLPLPVQASLEAMTVDWLIGLHLLLISFLFSLVVVFMLYGLFVFRKRDGDEEDGEHFHGHTTLEIAWTVIPLLLVLVFGFIAMNALADITRSESDEVTVQVTGFQWAWRFDYPEGFSSQELVLPVNRRVRLEMTATDVIHSFWVPEFRVKQDLVPGMTTTLRFTPVEVGEYKVRCAELCGLSHWSMLAPVRVVEEAEYRQWLQEKTAGLDPALVQGESASTE